MFCSFVCLFFRSVGRSIDVSRKDASSDNNHRRRYHRWSNDGGVSSSGEDDDDEDDSNDIDNGNSTSTGDNESEDCRKEAEDDMIANDIVTANGGRLDEIKTGKEATKAGGFKAGSLVAPSKRRLASPPPFSSFPALGVPADSILDGREGLGMEGFEGFEGKSGTEILQLVKVCWRSVVDGVLPIL